jgi:hypothetical protein
LASSPACERWAVRPCFAAMLLINKGGRLKKKALSESIIKKDPSVVSGGHGWYEYRNSQSSQRRTLKIPSNATVFTVCDHRYVSAVGGSLLAQLAMRVFRSQRKLRERVRSCVVDRGPRTHVAWPLAHCRHRVLGRPSRGGFSPLAAAAFLPSIPRRRTESNANKRPPRAKGRRRRKRRKQHSALLLELFLLLHLLFR